MMKWSHTLIAGSAIILLTNAVALGGAGYNRSGEPESQLQLTQRELQHSSWREGKDNSGITLELDWRVAQPKQAKYDRYYDGRWGEPPTWLNKAKMAELGFDVVKLASTSENVRYDDTQSRDVLLVLELDGQAYQQTLQRAKEYAKQSEGLLAGNSKSHEVVEQVKDAEENFQHEQNQVSRLFVIDAGLDVQKLRAAYPDRSRYAIVHGLVRPRTEWEMKNKDGIGGNISELHADRINVPLAFREVFNNSASYEVTVAFGKRLEPWLVTASKGLQPIKAEKK
jgi:hypothetical protein